MADHRRGHISITGATRDRLSAWCLERGVSMADVVEVIALREIGDAIPSRLQRTASLVPTKP